jgi:hypothetical protein
MKRFFWSWGFLEFVVGMIGLVILFYVEEDWRGAHAWAATRAEWEAKGETFDFNRLIPPPIPDDQNLGAIPLFKLEPAKYDDGTSYLGVVTLNRAMRTDLPGNELPMGNGKPEGGLPDMANIRKVIATDYSAAFKGATPPEDTLVQFDALYPFLSELRAAAATRPLFRLPEDYTILPPASRLLSPVTALIKLSKILTLHAILALDHHQSDLALEDIKINCQLASGAKRDPSLVGGLVAIGMAAISHGAIEDGLAQHEWSDAQLVEIDHTLAQVNFLADYQFAMRSELTESAANFDYYKALSHQHYRDHILDMKVFPGLGLIWSDGWWDDNKTRMAAFIFNALAAVDPRSRLVFPKVDSDLQHQIEQANARWDAYAPWNIFSNIAAGPITNAGTHFAAAQVRWVDEARIACGLERYRLAQGVYPASLDALAPAYIDGLPHDIMNGQPYHYQLRPEGTYLLYSVGWNQTDEGGKVVYKAGSPTQIDYHEGDWVWPTPR